MQKRSKRDREGHGMDRRRRARRRPRVREIAEREQARGALGAEMAPAEPEHGKGAERDDDDLRKRERERRRPDHPQRREECEERIDVAAEAHDLLAGRGLRDLERTAVRRAPDGLHHVAEIEPPFAEVHEAGASDNEKHRAPTRHRSPDRDCPRALANECDRSGALRPGRATSSAAGVAAVTSAARRARARSALHQAPSQRATRARRPRP